MLIDGNRSFAGSVAVIIAEQQGLPRRQINALQMVVDLDEIRGPVGAEDKAKSPRHPHPEIGAGKSCQ